MNKKGLAASLFAIIIVMFLFALSSLMALKGWNEFNDVVQNGNFTSEAVKEKIDTKITPMFSWGDKLFVMLFIALLISYLISAVTLPTEKPIFLLIFLGLLIVTTLLAMALANAWNFIENLAIVSSEAADLTFIDFFMKFFPIITFIVGLAGAVIFYGRTQPMGATDGY